MSRKGAKKRTHGRKLRSTGTKARTGDAASGASQAALIRKLKARASDLEKKLGEALEQQTATSEVLRVISRSPGELGPVFEAMLTNAVRICEASFGNLLLYDGNVFRHVALHNAPPLGPPSSSTIRFRLATGHASFTASLTPSGSSTLPTSPQKIPMSR